MLASKRLLLVLDNFERVVAAGSAVGELLAAAPNLKVLVTSRVLLRIYGEHEYPVPPLRLPAPAERRSLDALERNESIALYMARARAVRHDFRLTEANAAAVVEICHALDGLPLALELAAARTRLLAPAALLERLERRLDVLTEGPRDVDPRQQTLRSAIDWSYQLLEPAERALFARLAVFSGGCTFDAAVEVSSADPPALESLLANSLLSRFEAGGDLRVRMLETIREYAHERLDESGEAERLRRKHAEYFLDLGERAESELTGAAQAAWLDRLEAEHDNLRAALSWLLANEPGGAMRLAGSLYRFWTRRGFFDEGRQWTIAALEHDGGSPVARAKLSMAASHMTGILGEVSSSQQHAETALALYRELGDPAGSSRSLAFLAILSWLGEIDLERARAFADESVAVARAAGPHALAFALGVRVNLCLYEGELDRAQALGEEALALNRRTGDSEQLGFTNFNLALAALLRGDRTEARRLLTASLTEFDRVGHRWGLTDCLEAFSSLAALAGDWERAARLLGAGDSMRERIGARREPVEDGLYGKAVEAVEAELGDAADTLRAEGRAMPLEQAIASALELEVAAP